eukprot:TRINITY_DN1593_c0_g3_i2.p2 TRINITY_DN1593_c0_g3~~TRINITY_DN1593_c0_g3_i2.p2  ORF type:complete len:249 (-),score=-19.80 TRINITY_DN1593_c0_g3_i2:693-1439(-)
MYNPLQRKNNLANLLDYAVEHTLQQMQNKTIFFTSTQKLQLIHIHIKYRCSKNKLQIFFIESLKGPLSKPELLKVNMVEKFQTSDLSSSTAIINLKHVLIFKTKPKIKQDFCSVFPFSYFGPEINMKETLVILQKLKYNMLFKHPYCTTAKFSMSTSTKEMLGVAQSKQCAKLFKVLTRTFNNAQYLQLKRLPQPTKTMFTQNQLGSIHCVKNYIYTTRLKFGRFQTQNASNKVHIRIYLFTYVHLVW